jgi:hypothetical protein
MEYKYTHLPYGSTTGENEDLLTVVKKKVVKPDRDPVADAVSQKVRRKQPPAATPKSNERSSKGPHREGASTRIRIFGRYSIRNNARASHDGATSEHRTPVIQATSGPSSDSPIVSSSRLRGLLPSPTTQVDSTFATPAVESRQTAHTAHLAIQKSVESSLDEPGGDQSVDIMPDSSHEPSPSRSMFQQPGMTRRQSNAFVFDPTSQNLSQSRHPSNANASIVTTSAPRSKIAASAESQTPASNGLVNY